MFKIETLYQVFLESQGVSTDTRTLIPGNVFFAIKGEKFDAGALVNKALNLGAKAVVTQNTEWTNHPNVFVVDNVLNTLQNLALHHRRQLKIPVIAITGTNGKTTTKELMAAVLSRKYKVAFTFGNLNNEIGVPITILSINSSHEIAIVEMGASKMGDIDFLCNIAEPEFGIITNIGKAHLGGFGSYENIITTKTELYRFIFSKCGNLFVNADDELLMKQSQGCNLITYSRSSCGVSSIRATEEGLLAIGFSHQTESFTIKTQLVGNYNLPNVLAAINVGHFFGVEQSEITTALQEYTPGNSRSQLLRTKKNILIVDAYNANPSSMILALENFSSMDSKAKMLILGSMLELGTFSSDEHKGILVYISSMHVEKAILIGAEFYEWRNDYPQFSFFKTTDEVIEYLKEMNFTDYLILLKGSRGVAVERTIAVL